MSFKFVGVILLAILAAAGVGWMAGRSSLSVAEQQRARAEMRAEFADARAAILDARVNLFESNFGNAIEACQNARNRIGQIQTQLRAIGQPDQAGRLEIANTHLSDAQHLAAAFDRGAQDAAAQALKALDAAGSGGTP
jgi:hypothetical protein